MITLDDVDSAESLIAVIARFMGNDSETMKWAKRQLLEGHTPKEIAAAIIEAYKDED